MNVEVAGEESAHIASVTCDETAEVGRALDWTTARS
jgi:hypothetical protein